MTDILREEYIQDIARIEAECFSEPWSDSAFRSELTNPSAVYFVATEDGKAVGYGGMHIVLDEAYITNIAVDKNFRRRGIGRTLLEELINFCHSKSLSLITLEVRAGNMAAIELYTSLGFKKVGTRRNFYSAPTEDGDIMTLYF